MHYFITSVIHLLNNNHLNGHFGFSGTTQRNLSENTTTNRKTEGQYMFLTYLPNIV